MRQHFLSTKMQRRQISEVAFVFSAAEFHQSVQASAVLACIFSILALFVFVAQLFTLPKGQRFTFTGILQLISCK